MSWVLFPGPPILGRRSVISTETFFWGRDLCLAAATVLDAMPTSIDLNTERAFERIVTIPPRFARRSLTKPPCTYLCHFCFQKPGLTPLSGYEKMLWGVGELLIKNNLHCRNVFLWV